LAGYLIGTAVLLAISNLFIENVGRFIAVEIILLAILIIIAIAVMLFGIRIKNLDQRIFSDRKLMQICEKRILDFIHTNNQYKPQLEKIYEKLKYCDKIGASSVDGKIVGAIMKLEKGIQEQKDITPMTDEIFSFLLQRNTEISELKRGGF
jgi:hypothetical protein